jgi:DNA polymerase-3 subunit delta
MARRGRPSVRDFEKDLKAVRAEGPGPVCVVTGGQEWFRRHAVEACIAAVQERHPEIALAAYQGPASPSEAALPVESVTRELTSYGLFARQKLVVVRRAGRFLFPGPGEGGAEDDPLARYVAEPTDGMFLLLEAEKLDRRTRRGKALAKHARLIECPELRYDREVLPWLQGLARGMGLDLTPQAAEMLCTVHGAEPGILHGELEKLALFVEGTAQIDGRAVGAFLGENLALSFFELANAVEDRDLPRAINLARRTLRQGLTDQQGKRVDLIGTVHMALGSLRSCLGTLWQAHDVAARGGGAEELKPLLGPRAWRAGEILRAGQRFTLAELHRAYDALADGLAHMHDTGGDPAQTLERVVIAACGGPAPPRD